MSLANWNSLQKTWTYKENCSTIKNIFARYFARRKIWRKNVRIFSEMRNICHNVECRYFQKSENILLRCKILPPPTSTSSSPSSDKKWCAHNLYSLPLPSTLLLDNLSKIIFFFSHWSLYSSEICSPPASICSEDLSHPKMCSKLQIGPKKMNSRLFMFSLFDIF